MKYIPTLHRPGVHGFALIEALIAVVVLAIGLMALTALQGSLVRSSADSKARSQIAAYAAGEMDRIRTGAPVVASKTATAAADDISLTARAAGLSTLSQTSTEEFYYHDAASGTFATTNPNTGKNAWFRRVTLSMSWTDAVGGARQMSLATDISPLALSMSKVLVDREPSSDAGLRPVVRRPVDAVVAEGMIPIATGGEDGEATAATNPKPRLLGGNSGTYVSDTRFDIVTFSDTESNDFVRLNKKIETAVVGCTCQNNTDGFTRSGPGADLRAFLLAQGFRPTTWSGRTYTTPVAAVAAVNSSPVNISQSPLCDVCCRDHKDPENVSGPKFSPWAGQASAHYKLNGSVFELAASGEQYLEACRLIRVDGSFRVAADARIHDNAMVPTREYVASATSGSSLPAVSNDNSATLSNLDSEGKPLYESYVYDAVSDLFFSTTAVAASGNNVDFPATQQSNSLNLPSYVPIKPVNDRRWLHSRVFMVDYLEADARNRLREASADCADASTAVQRGQCVLAFVPLASINTTELAYWSPRAATAAEVAAAPSPLNTLNSNYLNYASAKIRRFNSGLALFSAINPNEATLDVANALSPSVDEQLFVQLASAAPSSPVWLDTPSPNPSTARFFGDVLNPMRGYAQTSAPLPFTLRWTFPTGNPGSPASDSNKGNDPAATVTGSGACTPGSAGNSSNPYACSSSSTSNIEISLAGYNRIEATDVNNNGDFCSGGGKVARPSCVVYSFTGATVNAPSATLLASDYVIAPGTSGKLTEQGTLVIPLITNGSSSELTVNFGNRTVTPATFTCSGTTPVWVLPCE